MNHDQAWFTGEPPQAHGLGMNAFEELDLLTLPSAPLAQPHTDGAGAPWSSEGTAYPPHRSKSFVHTHQQTPTHAYGLPSPALTAPAASPRTWPRHGIPSAVGGWGPVSPISPSACEGMGGGCGNQLDGFLHTDGTMTPPLFGVGLQSWPGADYQVDLGDSYAGVPPVQSLIADGAALPFHASWDKPSLVPTQPSEHFVETTPRESRLSEPARGPNHTPQLHLMESLHQPSSQPRKRNSSMSHRQQPSKRTKASDPLKSSPITTPAPATTTATATRTERAAPSPSALTAGPTLRTATRRFKRPGPSAKPGETPEHQRARTNHNMVEQQYRHRLHARFEALLDVLPEGLLDRDEDDNLGDDDAASTGTGVSSGVKGKGKRKGAKGSNAPGAGTGVKGKNNRRMSKVDVLSRAEKAIRLLERDVERTAREVEMLKREREMVLGRAGLGGGWVAVGGAAAAGR